MPNTVPAADTGLPAAKIIDDRFEAIAELVHAAQLCCRASDSDEADAADGILRVVDRAIVDIRQAVDACVTAHQTSTLAAWHRRPEDAEIGRTA